jgi:hypothetical protein
VTVASQVQMISSFDPQYQREWLGQEPYPAHQARPERLVVMSGASRPRAGIAQE